jgi:DNA primase
MFERKVRIIEDFLGSYYKSKDEFLFYCPKCKHHKPKFSLNFDKDVFKCWVCDYNGRSISRLVSSYGGSQNKSEWKSVCGIVDMSEQNKPEEEKITVRLPEEFISLTKKKVSPLSLPARNYLRTRGIFREDILWWKIGYCPDEQYGKRIVIPSFDLEGNINYFIARGYGDDWMKYKNPPAEKDFIFNELYLDWGKDITIVEGVFDAIKATNAIPLLGSTLRENSYIFQKIVENCGKVYIALDDDARAKEDKIIRILLSYGVDVYRVDTSGFGDVGEMDKKTFQARKKTAAFLSLDNYLLEKLSLQ